MTNLTNKQRAFVDHYIRTLNGTEAARCAKYKGNSVTLAAVAYENLRKPHVLAEIKRRIEEETITDSQILHRLSEQAMGDIGDALHVDHSYVKLDVTKLKEAGKTHLIKKYKVTKNGTELELHDSQSALVHLFKLRRLLDGRSTENVNQQVAITYIKENRD